MLCMAVLAVNSGPANRVVTLCYQTDKLSYNVSITYNALPLQLRSKEKLKTFKSLLYDHSLST